MNRSAYLLVCKLVWLSKDLSHGNRISLKTYELQLTTMAVLSRLGFFPIKLLP